MEANEYNQIAAMRHGDAGFGEANFLALVKSKSMDGLKDLLQFWQSFRGPQSSSLSKKNVSIIKAEIQRKKKTGDANTGDSTKQTKLPGGISITYYDTGNKTFIVSVLKKGMEIESKLFNQHNYDAGLSHYESLVRKYKSKTGDAKAQYEYQCKDCDKKFKRDTKVVTRLVSCPSCSGAATYKGKTADSMTADAERILTGDADPYFSKAKIKEKIAKLQKALDEAKNQNSRNALTTELSHLKKLLNSGPENIGDAEANAERILTGDVRGNLPEVKRRLERGLKTAEADGDEVRAKSIRRQIKLIEEDIKKEAKKTGDSFMSNVLVGPLGTKLLNIDEDTADEKTGDFVLTTIMLATVGKILIDKYKAAKAKGEDTTELEAQITKAALKKAGDSMTLADAILNGTANKYRDAKTGDARASSTLAQLQKELDYAVEQMRLAAKNGMANVEGQWKSSKDLILRQIQKLKQGDAKPYRDAEANTPENRKRWKKLLAEAEKAGNKKEAALYRTWLDLPETTKTGDAKKGYTNTILDLQKKIDKAVANGESLAVIDHLKAKLRKAEANVGDSMTGDAANRKSLVKWDGATLEELESLLLEARREADKFKESSILSAIQRKKTGDECTGTKDIPTNDELNEASDARYKGTADENPINRWKKYAGKTMAELERLAANATGKVKSAIREAMVMEGANERLKGKKQGDLNPWADAGYSARELEEMSLDDLYIVYDDGAISKKAYDDELERRDAEEL